MLTADFVRRALQAIPDAGVPYPDAWRYAFIALGLLIAGLTLAIATEARRFRSSERPRVRRTSMTWHIRLVAFGTNLIILLLVASLYLRTGRDEPLSPLIYPGMLGELSLAAGLATMLASRLRTKRKELS